ncbi:MAG TPA: hypothetical protein VK923_01560 [Euzebyales bacterium]|nr:hypothetical protein [Euzebyales bacterium]
MTTTAVGDDALLTDAGPLVAAATREANHASSRGLFRDAVRRSSCRGRGRWRSPNLLGSRFGAHAELTLVGSLRDGELMVEPVHERDWQRIAELVEADVDVPPGVDASVVAVAERL